jgi:hypothetical protein
MKWKHAARALLKAGIDPSIVCVDGLFSDGFISPMPGPGSRPAGPRTVPGPNGTTRQAHIHPWPEGHHRLHSTIEAAARDDYREHDPFGSYSPRRGRVHTGETFL